MVKDNAFYRANPTARMAWIETEEDFTCTGSKQIDISYLGLYCYNFCFLRNSGRR